MLFTTHLTSSKSSRAPSMSSSTLTSLSLSYPIYIPYHRHFSTPCVLSKIYFTPSPLHLLLVPSLLHLLLRSPCSSSASFSSFSFSFSTSSPTISSSFSSPSSSQLPSRHPFFHLLYGSITWFSSGLMKLWHWWRMAPSAARTLCTSRLEWL